MIRSCL